MSRRYNAAMPAPPQGNSLSAGVSSPEHVDVAALFASLQEQLRSGGASSTRAGDGRPPVRISARTAAERFWPVSGERALQPTPGVRGAIKRFVQRAIRRALRWYVEPLAADQRSFNDAALKLIDDLYERGDRAFADQEADARLLRELDERLRLAEERLRRLERRGEDVPATVAAQPAAATLPDYFAFETRMRPASSVRERQRVYVDDFRGQAPVLDVGCGRGELLTLLRDAGIDARGIDADSDMVAYARGEGLDVEQADVLAYLDALEDGTLGGIFAGQVVEHLPPPALLRFLQLSRQKLRLGGVLIAETINPLSPIALRHYFADLTHSQPLVPETLELLATQAGFAEVETRYLNEPEAGLETHGDPELEAYVARVNEVVFAPLDYAIVARA
jgi:SAM-dependent methyltransferase